MRKITISKKAITTPHDIEGQEGILYLLVIQLEEKTLIKIGMTSRRVEERVCEVLTAIWKRYRVFPECKVKRYRTVKDVFKKEAYLHSLFTSNRYTTKYSFGGSTEFFDCALDEVVAAYDDITG